MSGTKNVGESPALFSPLFCSFSSKEKKLFTAPPSPPPSFYLSFLSPSHRSRRFPLQISLFSPLPSARRSHLSKEKGGKRKLKGSFMERNNCPENRPGNKKKSLPVQFAASIFETGVFRNAIFGFFKKILSVK